MPALTTWALITTAQRYSIIIDNGSSELKLGLFMWRAQDVRIKMCASVNQEDLYVMHHELGHIFYFQAYSTQSYLYR